MPLQHLRSSTANKRPTPASMSDGQLAINTNLASPGLFFKDSNGALVKVGPVHVGTTAPNASPAVGGQAGNSVGEQWLDTSSSRYVFKVWDGTAWRSESGEFVDASGDVMTGALGIIAGSAGAPGLYFSGDTNTGIFSAGADTLAISTGGVAALQILNDGGLFVGRPTGDARVEIGGGATGNRTAYIDLIGDTTNADYGLRIQRGETGVNATSLIANKGSGSVVLRTEGAGPLIFDTNNTERLRIDSSGNVGIGTGSPTHRLNVAGDVSLDTGATTGGRQATYALGVSDIGTVGQKAQIAFAGAGTNGFLTNITFSNFIGDFFNSTLQERMRIDSSGNIGIGTSSPEGRLQSSSTAAQVAFMAASATADPQYPSFGFSGQVGSNGNRGAGMYLPADSTLAFSTTGTERLRIDSSGNVGIGTSSPWATQAIRFDTTGNGIAGDVTTARQFSVGASSAYQVALGYYQTGAAQPFAGVIQALDNSAATRLLLNPSGGNVGIGTSVPATPLQVGNSAGSGAEAINKGTIQINAGPTGLTQDGGLEFKTSIFGSGYGWRIAGAANGSTNPLLIGVRSNSTTWTTRVAIEDTGNIGVGTTAPGAQLHLYEATAASFRLQQASCTFNSYVASGDYTCGTITNHPFVFTTNNAERVRITAGGSVGIGTSVPEAPLHVNGTIYTKTATNPTIGIWNTTSTFSTFLIQESAEFKVYTGAGQPITFANNGNERLRIDSSGRLLVGTSTSIPGAYGGSGKFQSISTSSAPYYAGGFYGYHNDTNPTVLQLGHSRSSTPGHTILQNGDAIGSLRFEGSDGVGFIESASITAAVDGTPGANDMPGRLVFSTTADGAASPTERFRIDSSGNASFAGTGALKLHAGTTAERPGTPTTGMVRYNSSITQFEGYNGSAWGTIGGGAKGAGSDQVFFENDQTVTTSYTITAGKNAMSAGPVTIGSGVTVTVPSGSVWVVV